MFLDAWRRASGAFRRRQTDVLPFEGGDSIVATDNGAESTRSPKGHEAMTRSPRGNSYAAWDGGVPSTLEAPAQPFAGAALGLPGEVQRQLQSLHETCQTLGKRLEESQERQLQLEVELRSERLVSRRALDDLAAARSAAERQPRCRFCGRDGRETDEAEEANSHRKRRNGSTGSKVAFNHCPEVMMVEIDGDLNRKSRSRQGTGGAIMAALAKGLKDDPSEEPATCAAAASSASSSSGEQLGSRGGLKKSRDDSVEEPATGAASSSSGEQLGSRRGLKKSRERVPTGSTSWEDLEKMGILDLEEADMTSGGATSSTDNAKPPAERLPWEPVTVDGRGTTGQKRKVRGATMSCHILLNKFALRADSDAGSDEDGDNFPDPCMTVVLPPNMRRCALSGELQMDKGQSHPVTPSKRRASSIASFHSGTSASGTMAQAAEEALAKVGMKDEGQGPPSEDPSCSTACGDKVAADTAAVGQANLSRRISQLRATAFVLSTARRKKVAFTVPGEGASAAPRGGQQAVVAVARGRRVRKKTHSSFVPEEVVANALEGEEPSFADPRAHAEHLATLARYGRWRVPQVLPPDEPSGVLIKGGGEQLPLSDADSELLAQAVPELAALGLDAQVTAQFFKAYQVSAGEVLWCEDTPTDQVFVVGVGTRLALARHGRSVRDAVQGDCLGVEALQKGCRWAHMALVTHGGEVWVMEVDAVRELLLATAREEGFAQLADTLASAALFKQLSPLQRAVLAAHAEVLQLKKDECLVGEGEHRVPFYILSQGALAVMEDGRTVKRYSGAGQSLCVPAVLNAPGGCNTTVTAMEPSSVIALSEELLTACLGGGLQLLLQRSTVRQVFRGSESPSGPFAGAGPETLELWAERCRVLELGPGEEAQEEALCGMLVVLSGGLLATEKLTDKGSAPTTVVQPYEVFGQEHLLERPSDWLLSLSAGVEGASVAWLPRSSHEEVFEHCTKLSELVAHQQRVALVREIFIFRHLSERQCSTLVHSMTLITRQRGETVIQEGNHGAEFFIIHEGDVNICKNSNYITKLSQPAYFGERALLYEEPRAATVTVASESATFCVLTKQAFLEILNGGILDFIAYRNKLLDTDLQFSDLEIQMVIGRGGYGIVKLVRHKSSGTRYALKCVTREKLNDQDIRLVQRERAILQLIDHPFCLKLVRSFKDDNCVYFLTELVTGGELLDALDRLDVLNREQAQFYFGSLVIVFEYIHEKNVLYRDLKPENVLLDQDGFIKLIDFGAARRLDNPLQKCYTLLGTPHFMSTEMLLGHGYDMRADIWAMGVCLFEFVVGRLPFDGDEPETIFKSVASRRAVQVPEDLDPASAEMLRWLLQKDPADRPEASARGYKAIREHRFFQGFSFEALINRSVRPPMVPQGEQYSAEQTPASLATEDDAESGPWRHAGHGTVVDGWDAEF